MSRTLLLVAGVLLYLVAPTAGAQSEAPARPHVVLTEIDGIIHPVTAEYSRGR
jgi:hypothetical protein